MTPDDPDTAAAELALGLLDGDERATALRRVLADPAFAAEVERWRTHFGGLFAAVPDHAPGDPLLPRIERSIAGGTDAPVTVVPSRAGRLWPAVAALTSLAAAVLLAVVVIRPGEMPRPAAPATPAMLAAAVVPVQAGEPVSAVYDPATGALRLTAAALADARHSAELWVIGGDGVPHSLGLLHDGATTTLAIAPAGRARLTAAAVLAVSIEPVGGSPTGLPTGPVVAKGTLVRT